MADIITNTLQIGSNNLILQDAGARQDIATNTQDISDLKDGLGEITEEVQSVNFFSGYTENGGINNTSGADTTSTAYVRTGYIPIDASEETLYILRTTSPWGMRVFFYDETQTFISPNVQIFNGSATTLTGSASIPSNAVYVRTFRDATATGDVEFSYTQESEYTPYGSTSELKDKIVSEEKLTDELNLKIASAEDVPKIESDLLTEKTVNIFDGEFPNSGYFDANGADASSSSWKRTDYIPINPTNTTLYFLRTAQPYLLAYCFYDSTKTASGVRTNAFGGTVTELKASAPIPSNAAYIRMYTSASAYSGNLMLSYTDQDTYIPHGDLFFLKDASVSENNLDDALKAKVNKGLELTGKTIAFMGDSIIGNFYDATGVCAHLAEKTGATVINCAFGGSRIAYRYGSNVQYTYWNALSGAGLADAIASGDWTSQDTAVANMTGGLAYFAERLAQVKAVDWSTVDFIMWEYGTNDFMTEVKLDGADLYAYNYAYRHTIETILTAYPTIRIITVTPAYRWYQAEGVFTEDSNTHLEADYAGVQTKLTDFVAMAQTISREYQIPCIDDYYTLGANRYTRLSFFDSTDGTHPNAQGRERIAEHIASQLVTLI